MSFDRSAPAAGVIVPRGFAHVRLTDHLSLLVGPVEELHRAAERLQRAGVTHGRVTELPAFALAILSVQDPDDINLELTARLTGP